MLHLSSDGLNKVVSVSKSLNDEQIIKISVDGYSRQINISNFSHHCGDIFDRYA